MRSDFLHSWKRFFLISPISPPTADSAMLADYAIMAGNESEAALVLNNLIF
ncbi:hypothetical protein [Peredibacter starrii]|uniref:Uncharacterized protein n=1 Tax=Peredibacter starrii TaxID=28202 RepID=A0AAX4HTX4_9BACT|nr:hypothetical protein [Peredibacter starrii]WPU66528.1 hypothetical protein SOO65_07200 [Peredibacter starrii]